MTKVGLRPPSLQMIDTGSLQASLLYKITSRQGVRLKKARVRESAHCKNNDSQ